MAEELPPSHFRACCNNVIKVLRQIGVGSPELDARLLISDALGLTGAAFFLEPDRLLSEEELSEIALRLTRRMAGEPVSRIVGARSFWKHDFIISPDVLDPRPDSETLIETALELIENSETIKNNRSDKMRILDLGTGSGALLISLLLEFPDALGVGIDQSTQALGVARENAKRLGCLERVEFLEQNWLDGFSQGNVEPFDLVVCNPPYIAQEEIAMLDREVRDFDPHQALDGGEDGLDPYRLIIPQLRKVLGPEGFAVFEIGDGQHEAVSELFDQAELFPVGEHGGCYRDLSGIIRCLAATPTKKKGSLCADKRICL